MPREISPSERAVGDAIRKFGKERFQSMSSFASALEVSPQYLNAYLTASKRPGPVFLRKLVSLGFDPGLVPDFDKTEFLDPAKPPLPGFRAALVDAMHAMGRDSASLARKLEIQTSVVDDWIRGADQPEYILLGKLFILTAEASLRSTSLDPVAHSQSDPAGKGTRLRQGNGH